MHELGKLFGMNDIELGGPEIDAAFTTTTNNPFMLADPVLRQTPLHYPGPGLILKAVCEPGKVVLEFSQDTAITEPAQLQEIYDLLPVLLQKIAPLPASVDNGVGLGKPAL